jgi:PAS domain S-box-containing protein
MTLLAKWTLAFVAALLLLSLLGLMSFRRLKQEDVAQRWVSHTHQVMEQLDLPLAASLELDAKQGTEGNANPQLNSQTAEKLEANLSAIKTLTADNPRQQAAVEQLANLVHARAALWLSAPTSPETPAKSMELLDQIRLVLLAMRQEEERLEGERLRTVQSQSQTARVILGTGFAFALALLAFTGLSVLSETARRTRTEERLRNAQERFRLLFDSNPIPTWVFDMETLVIVAVNATALKTYGYTHEEFLRFKITDIRPPEDVPSLLDSIHKENASSEDSGPWRHRKKSGEVIDVQIRSYPLKFDGKPARLVVATDITEKSARKTP